MQIDVKLTDGGELVAAKHGPWCEDHRTFPPPPRCEDCQDSENGEEAR